MDSSELLTLWAAAHGPAVLEPDAPADASYRVATLPPPADGATVPAPPDTNARALSGAPPFSGEEVGRAPAPPVASEVLDDFELLGELGRGGMGVVYRARQASLERDVAVKLIRPEQRSARAHERFVAEARVSGALDHPNIVPVHMLGKTAGGHAFLAMKRVSGRSWKALLHPANDEDRAAAAATDLAAHLAILANVCNAVAFAHARGIVHRDLKPENVMVGEFGEVMVMDWGIAVDIREPPVAGAPAQHRSLANAPAGTPCYMPPELAEGRGCDIGPWTDTYLLGAILCEILTGAPPHSGANLGQILQAASASVPPALDAAVPADLAAIVRRALARATGERYATAFELQHAVREHLRFRESDRIAGAARKRLEAARGADGSSSDARRRLYSELTELTAAFGQALVIWPGNAAAADDRRASRMLHARLALAGGDLGLARAQLEALAEGGVEGEAEKLLGEVLAEEAHAAKRVVAARRMRHGALALALALVAGLAVGFVWIRAERNEAEAQRAVAVSRRQEAERAKEDAQRQRDEATLRLAQALVAEGDAQAASRDWESARRRYEDARATFAKVGAPDRQAQLGLLDLYRQAPTPLLVLGREEAPDAPQKGTNPTRDTVAFSADGARVMSGGADQRVMLWDARSGRLIRALEGHYARVTGVAFLPGERAVSVGEDCFLHVWDLASGRELRRVALGTPTLHNDFRNLTVCADGRLVLVARVKGMVYRIDPDRGRLLPSLDPAAMPTRFARVSLSGLSATADGRKLLTLAESRFCPMIWDARTMAHEKSLCAAGATCPVGALSPDGRFAAGGGQGRELALVDVASDRVLHTLTGHRDRVTSVTFSPDGTLIASCARDQTVRLWEVATGRELRIFTGHMRTLQAVAFSPDGETLASAADDGTVRLWPVKGSPAAHPWTVGPVDTVEFTPDASLALASGSEGSVLFDPATALPLARIALPPFRSGRVRLAAAGKMAVVATARPPGVTVLDLEHPGASHSKALVPADVPGSYGLAISGDGRRVFTLGTERPDGDLGDTLANSDAVPRVHGVRPPGLVREAAFASVAFDAGPAARPAARDPLAGVSLFANELRATRSPSVRGGGFDCVEASPDGASIATATYRVTVRRMVDGGLVRELEGAPHEVRRLAFSHDGQRIAAAGGDRIVPIWETATGKRVSALVDEAGTSAGVAFAPDGTLVATASASARVHLHDPSTGRRLRSLDAHTGACSEVAFSPDGRWLVTAGDRETFTWDLSYPARLATAEGEASRARATLSERPDDGAALAALGRYYALREVGPTARDLLRQARAHGASVPALEMMRVEVLAHDAAAALAELAHLAPADLAPAAAHHLKIALAALAEKQRAEDRSVGVDRALREASAAVDRGDWRAAVDAATRGLALEPGHEHLRVRRCRGWVGLGEYRRALEDVDAWIRIAPRSPTAQYAKSVILRKAGDPQGALEALERASALAPEDLGMMRESVSLRLWQWLKMH